MNNDQRMILQQIINCDKTAEKIALVNENRNLLGNVQIVLFDENVSNFNGFEDRVFGKYFMCGIADYNKCWIIDGQNPEMKLNVYGKAYFDINMISRIDDCFRGHKIEDKSDLIDLLSYIKNEKYDLEIGNSIVERMSKSYDESLFRQSIESFYEYMEIEHFGERLPAGFETSDRFTVFYDQYKNVGSMSQDAALIRQYNFLLCLTIKAILIKADKRIKDKCDELVRFSLSELKCLITNELYLLSLYLLGDKAVGRTFAKFHSSIKGGLEAAVRNSVWDIYHARIVEQEMALYDQSTHTVELPFFVTNDRGIRDYWNVNPRKMVVLDNGTPISVYSHNVYDIETMLQDKTLYDQMINPDLALKREKEVQCVDIDHILNDLLPGLQTVNI